MTDASDLPDDVAVDCLKLVGRDFLESQPAVAFEGFAVARHAGDTWPAWMADPKDKSEFGPGDLLFFKRTIVHALPDILEGPVVFLSVDAPRRQPKDIIFVNSEDGTPETFIRGL